MTLTETNSTYKDILGRIVAKVLRFGKATIGIQVAPWGDDSNPIKGMIAVYAESTTQRQPVIIGYFNKNSLAGIGEKRIYSTDADGNIMGQVWLKNDGSAQSTPNCSAAVLGDKNKIALTDFYDLAEQMQVFTTACMESITDPTLRTAATALNEYLNTALPAIQADIDATQSINVALN